MSEVKDIMRPITGLNLDDDQRDLQPGEYRYALNGRSTKTPGSNQLTWQKFKGMDKSSLDLPAGTNTCVAIIEDKANDAALLVFKNSNDDHSIIRFYPNTQVSETILDSQSILNLKSEQFFNGSILDGYFYFTDGYDSGGFFNTDYNPPRMLDLQKAKRYTDSDKINYYRISANLIGGVNYVRIKTGWPHGFSVGDYVFITGFGSAKAKEVTGYTITLDLTVGAFGDYISGTGYVLDYDVFKNQQYYEITRQLLDRIKYPPTYRPEKSNKKDLELENPDRTIGFTDGIATDEDYERNDLLGSVYTFRYRYVYDDNTKSVWSMISEPFYLNDVESAGGGFTEEITDNVLGVQIHTGVFEVKAIEIAVREGRGEWMLAERLEKFDQHGYEVKDYHSNTYITWPFFNNVIKTGIDQKDVSRLQDYVPQVAGITEIIEKNRCVDLNITEGFDNITTDVTLEQLKEEITPQEPYITIPITVETIDFYDVGGAIIQRDCLKLDFGTLGILASYPISWLFSATFTLDPAVGGAQTRIASFYQYELGSFPEEIIKSFVSQMEDAFSNEDPPPLGFVGNPINDQQMLVEIAAPTTYTDLWYTGYAYNDFGRQLTFKNKGTYRISINYYDGPLRTNGAQKAGEISFKGNIRENVNGAKKFRRNRLKWSVDHTPPEWARYYSIGITKHLNFSKYLDFFVSQHEINYADNVTEINIHTGLTSLKEHTKKSLLSYSFEDGDRLRIIYGYNKSIKVYFSNNTDDFDYEVLGIDYPEGSDTYQKDESDEPDFILDADGNKVRKDSALRLRIRAVDLATYSEPLGHDVDDCIFYVEVYNPRKQAEEEFYHEATPLYEIGDPHTDNRYHKGPTQNQSDTQPATGIIEGHDTWIGTRVVPDLTQSPLFVVESMHFSDYYISLAPLGRELIYNENARRENLESSYRHGGKYIENTNVNNICKYEYEDYGQLSGKFGSITYAKEVGYTLKVLQERKQTSIYIGRSGLQQAKLEGMDVVTTSENVLGTIYPHNDEYGCQDPASVAVNGRTLYFYDRLNRMFIRAAPNGAIPISEYKVRSAFEDIANLIDASTSTVNVLSCYDLKKNELTTLFYESHNIGSGADATNYGLMFLDQGDMKRWRTYIDYTDADGNLPERLSYVAGKLISVMGGSVYTHEQNNSLNLLYDDQKSCVIEVIANKASEAVKLYRSVDLESNKPWAVEFFVPSNDLYENGMYSKLMKGNFVNIEGKFHSEILRDMGPDRKVYELFNGREVRGQSLRIRLTDDTGDDNRLYAVLIKSMHSKISG